MTLGFELVTDELKEDKAEYYMPILGGFDTTAEFVGGVP
jgi:hypothetical protein